MCGRRPSFAYAPDSCAPPELRDSSTGSLASQPATAALLGAYHAARFALIHVDTRFRVVESSRIRLVPAPAVVCLHR